MAAPIVVITGGSAGIGRACAVEFARQGWRVALLARGAEGLAGARRAVEEAGGEALPIATDVADAAQVEAAAARVEREWGAIEVWVNNAMATVFCPVDRVELGDFARATAVTYLGSVWGVLAALRRMKSRDRGTIVQVGSALAYRSIPLQAAYCGAKSALRGFIDSLRCELIHDRSRVHITLVELSAFNTPQFDWARNRLGKRPQPTISTRRWRKTMAPTVASTIALASSAALWWATQRLQRTFRDIYERLSTDGLLFRYSQGVGYDGVPGTENPFVVCNFWAVDFLARSGRIDDATRLYERLLAMANDVGLYAEQFDKFSGAALGNFPQAFSHSGVITAAIAIEQARAGSRGARHGR